jgi:hypothetical protein
MEFQGINTYSNLGRTRVVYKARRLWAVEEEEVKNESKPIFLNFEKIRSECGDGNGANSPAEPQIYDTLGT